MYWGMIGRHQLWCNPDSPDEHSRCISEKCTSATASGCSTYVYTYHLSFVRFAYERATVLVSLTKNFQWFFVCFEKFVSDVCACYHVDNLFQVTIGKDVDLPNFHDKFDGLFSRFQWLILNTLFCHPLVLNLFHLSEWSESSYNRGFSKDFSILRKI